MNRPPRPEINTFHACASQHAEWLREEIEELLDARFLAYEKATVDEAEIAHLRNEIETREDVISHYRTLGLLP
ncbi:hypothetical protein [Rhizobium sp. BK376]|uniref:hypothetical protein n=1 Tax=Rhizobium sp. BK376 TaxID=2512149 RepID=UPI00104608D3|nr:hypothetical protein [Rhizobium sp. BK376]TCR85253.1 hypothetical protein EV561_10724 [Rhizobium sp. BK376]